MLKTMFCKMEMMQDLCAIQILSTLLSLVTQSLKSDSILKLFIITLILFDFGFCGFESYPWEGCS